MMGVLNNNKGYVLAVVLILSILIPVIFLSFLAISSNTTKQNESIESTLQSQSIAEMGAGYFQNAMTNEIITKEKPIILAVVEQREKDVKKNIIKNDDYYKGLAITAMHNDLQRIVNTLNKNVTIQQNNQNSFTITPTNGSSFFSVAGDKLMIDFISTGHDELKEADIKGSIEVNFADIFSMGTGSSGTGSILQNNTIPDPGTNLKTCPKEKKADFTNESCQIHGSISYDQNDNLIFNTSIYRVSGGFVGQNINNKIDNSTLYILGSMMAGNLNSMDRLKLHVDGALNVGHFNGSGLVNSIIEVGGSASMDNIKLTRSTMYIGGSTTIGNINGMEDSTIFINSDASIKGADLNKNAKICVNGNLEIGNINNNSNNTSNIYAKESNNTKVITNHAAFEAACTGGGSTVTSGSIDFSTNYDYSY